MRGRAYARWTLLTLDLGFTSAVGVNYTMSGADVVPVKAFTPTQARSAFALWVALASPLMIGADIRSMDADSRSVWLNHGLIAAHQDPLGKQGIRLRGTATAPQVWRRELAQNDLLVVVFNPDTSDSATAASAPVWSGPHPHTYTDAQCPNVGNHPGLTADECKSLCQSMLGCDAFNFGDGCALRACPAPQVGNPTGVTSGDTSYCMTSVPPPPAPPPPVFVTVTWQELALPSGVTKASVVDLINDVPLGTLDGGVTVKLTAGESAALRVTPLPASHTAVD